MKTKIYKKIEKAVLILGAAYLFGQIILGLLN